MPPPPPHYPPYYPHSPSPTPDPPGQTGLTNSCAELLDYVFTVNIVNNCFLIIIFFLSYP